MHNVLVKILKTLGIIAAFLVVLFVIAIFIVESPTIQNKVMKRATAMLTEKLGRRVEVEKAHRNARGSHENGNDPSRQGVFHHGSGHKL